MKRLPLLVVGWVAVTPLPPAAGHGATESPKSRVLRVFEANPENPSFELAANAVAADGKSSYYTWNQVSQNIPEAVQAGLPPGFDYSPWVPDGHLASGGRFAGNVDGLLYAGLDQVSGDWPTTEVAGGQSLSVDFFATAPHEPSVWDVWMTTPDWSPEAALNWGQMEFLGRATPTLDGNHYRFDVAIPADRSGHHVLWIAWQRDDPVGEVFFSASDLLVAGVAPAAGDFNGDGQINAADYTVWRDSLGGDATLPGDPTPGSVTLEDYAVWKGAISQQAPEPLASPAPAPAAAAVAVPPLLQRLGGRRRRGT